jgi:hypothetical protein
VIMPPVPAFYTRPTSSDDIVNGTVGRALLRLGIDNTLYSQWSGKAMDLILNCAELRRTARFCVVVDSICNTCALCFT